MTGSVVELLAGWHPYLSTWCLHGLHDRCGEAQAERGEAGAPHCKSCPQVCICPVCDHAEMGSVLPRPRGVYSAYKSLRTQRMHVIRDAWMVQEDGVKARTRIEPGRQTLCGQHAWGTVKAPTTVVDPLPPAPPDGFTWCPGCQGGLAEVLGFAGLFGVLLAGVRAGFPPPTSVFM